MSAAAQVAEPGPEPADRPAPGAAEPAGARLELSDLHVGYGGAPVLHGVDLVVEPGGILALLGANGAGKTTLLRTLAGFVRPSSGGIRFGGLDLAARSVEDRARLGIAQVPEGRSVVAELTVEENLRLGALRLPRRERAAALAGAYERFDALARRRSSFGHQLSGGERQQLALARALVTRPRLLVLDEPSLGLAPKIVAQLFGVLRDAAEQDGLTVLLAEQNVTSALSIADRGVVLHLGRVVADRPAAELAADPDLRHAYLGF
ncbi:ABC transporter ATP-binding protein [Agromyces seonyuensis]|uniref:ATP-binding cassette domain-containing protein n=1 Tax=Agromyces seonyuensis TaxID=2662446 RepID=A0A6I4P6M9_9MICO|nr:ABC transporter ATP-binding protein [Agromyces seonyuensis]MWB99314.1 ATP-binding cassette domain-containing protein [Agromyces seonyuensis]